jgi:membrane protease YdiL (CAAX protease family)
MVPPLVAIACYLLLIGWRFGASCLRSAFGLRHALSFPSVLLFVSAAIQFETSIHSLASESTTAFLIPIQEELLYRLILPRTLKKYCSQTIAIILSTTLFCFAHRVNDFSASDLAVCIVAGLCLGVRTERRNGRILEPLLLHVLHNVHVLNQSDPNVGTMHALLGPLPFYGSVLGYDLFKLRQATKYSTQQLGRD